jgi:hypothetical protein
MNAVCNLALVFHGAVVLLLSQFAGYAFFRVLRGGEEANAKAAAMWRMSHSACSAAAVFLIALGPVVPHLHLTPIPVALLIDMLIVSTYAFCMGTVIAALSGHRGTRPARPWSNVAVYGLYVIGALCSTISGFVFLYGATRAYLD